MPKSLEANFAGRLVQRLGEHSVLLDANSQQSFAGSDPAAQIRGFASGFLNSGLVPGDRILISCAVNSASALAYLGAMYAGCVPVPVDERTVAASGGALADKSKAKAVWTGARVEWYWARKQGLAVIEEHFPPDSQDNLKAYPASDNDLAALMPTSGSTGSPHLVMVTHGNLRANTEAIIASQHLGPDETAMLIMPVSYCFGASVLHSHLYQGGGVVFDSRFMFPDKVLHAINTYRCTTFAGVPTVFNILLRRSNLRSIALPSLRRFLQAGGWLTPQRIAEFREIVPTADFFVMYGQTEATARIACLPADCIVDKLGSVGVPLDNVTLRIADDQDRQLAAGETGEIQVSGPSVCAGYLDEPDATERKFAGGWLRTGDLGCLDEDGYIWLKGRTSEFIKIRGVRVSLAEVEAKVMTVAGVSDCAAAGVHHAEAGEALALFIVEDVRNDDGTQSLVEKIRSALPGHWTCASVRLVSELPRTSNGKIARAELQAFA
jgi:acyl-CoA synthetase (AMP-forming)/AMP-acid ligase II